MLVHRFYGTIRSKSRDEKGLYPFSHAVDDRLVQTNNVLGDRMECSLQVTESKSYF